MQTRFFASIAPRHRRRGSPLTVSRRATVPVLTIVLLAVTAASSSAVFEQIQPGIYRSNPKTIDDLLTISDHPEVSILVLDDSRTRSVSDSHMAALRQWVAAGGVLWVAGDGLHNSLAQAVAPFRRKNFDFVRSTSGKRGGELIIRGLTPRMTIADHELTEGVSQLYLFARTRFDGTAQAVPLVKMGDSEGNSGWVLVAVEVGRGLAILDGTAREGRFLRKLKGFDKKHPNSLKQSSGWNSYDWEVLRGNVHEHAHRAQQAYLAEAQTPAE